MARKRKNKLTPALDPAVQTMDELIRTSGRSNADIGARAGVSPAAISLWYNSLSTPTTHLLRAVLNELGYDLAVVKLDTDEQP